MEKKSARSTTSVRWDCLVAKRSRNLLTTVAFLASCCCVLLLLVELVRASESSSSIRRRSALPPPAAAAVGPHNGGPRVLLTDYFMRRVGGDRGRRQETVGRVGDLAPDTNGNGLNNDTADVGVGGIGLMGQPVDGLSWRPDLLCARFNCRRLRYDRDKSEVCCYRYGNCCDNL